MEKSIREILQTEHPDLKSTIKPDMASISDIELTEEELADAIIQAKFRKKDLQAIEVRKERERKNREAMVDHEWTPDQTRDFMNYRAQKLFAGKFCVDKENAAVFNLLCHYFSDDKTFESIAITMGIKNPSLDKGILLVGNFGSGKSWLMKLFQKNRRQVFHVKSSVVIAESWGEDGGDHLELFKNPYLDPESFYQPFSGVCLDDLGNEALQVRYGNRKSVIGDLIEHRYNKNILGHSFTGRQSYSPANGGSVWRTCDIPDVRNI